MTLCRTNRLDRVHVGDQPVFRVEVKDVDGVLADPTDGRLLIERPDGSVTSVAFASLTVLDGIVTYAMNEPLDMSGRWDLWWEFTAGQQGAEPFSFVVEPMTVPDV